MRVVLLYTVERRGPYFIGTCKQCGVTRRAMAERVADAQIGAHASQCKPSTIGRVTDPDAAWLEDYDLSTWKGGWKATCHRCSKSKTHKRSGDLRDTIQTHVLRMHYNGDVLGLGDPMGRRTKAKLPNEPLF